MKSLNSKILESLSKVTEGSKIDGNEVLMKYLTRWIDPKVIVSDIFTNANGTFLRVDDTKGSVGNVRVDKDLVDDLSNLSTDEYDEKVVKKVNQRLADSGY